MDTPSGSNSKSNKPLGRKRANPQDPVRASRSHYEARFYARKWLVRVDDRFAAVIAAIKDKQPREAVLAMTEVRADPEALAWLDAHQPHELPEHLQQDEAARRARSRRVQYSTRRSRALRALQSGGLLFMADRNDLDDVAAAVEARVARADILAMEVVTRNERLAAWLDKKLPPEPTP